MVKVISGAVTVQSFDGVIAKVSGSIMGVQLSDKHYIDCYEGHCSAVGNISNPIAVMDGTRRHLIVEGTQLSVIDVVTRCQTWQSLLGSVFQQLGVADCVLPTPSPTPKPYGGAFTWADISRTSSSKNSVNKYPFEEDDQSMFLYILVVVLESGVFMNLQ